MCLHLELSFPHAELLKCAVGGLLCLRTSVYADCYMSMFLSVRHLVPAREEKHDLVQAAMSDDEEEQRRPGGEEGDEGSCLPVFISKLMRMLSPGENAEAISWGTDGTTVSVLSLFAYISSRCLMSARARKCLCLQV